MKIITLTKEEFDRYANNHPYRNFYQTSYYGELMGRHGFNIHYIGFVDKNNEIKAASLILYKKIFKIYKYAYAPRGFLIDYNDIELIKSYTIRLKRLLKKQKFIFIKIDPYVLHRTLDRNGNVIKEHNSSIIKQLKSLGYIKKVYNDDLLEVKPRYNAILKLNKTMEELFSLFIEPVKNNIRKAHKKGIEIHKGSRHHIETLYNLIPYKHFKNIDYYYDYYDIFKEKDMIDLYYAKINPMTLLEVSKKEYNEEILRNQELNDLLQSDNYRDKENILNKKIESDALLDLYKKNIVDATKILKDNPNGLITAAAMVIKYNKELYFLVEGINTKYKQWDANYLLKWALITEFAKKGYDYINFNGVSDDFNKNKMYEGLNKLKLGYTNQIDEFIGEFDLPINISMYRFLNNSRIISKYISKLTKRD